MLVVQGAINVPLENQEYIHRGNSRERFESVEAASIEISSFDTIGDYTQPLIFLSDPLLLQIV